MGGNPAPSAPKHPVRRRNRERALPPHPVVFHPCPVRSAVVPGRREKPFTPARRCSRSAGAPHAEVRRHWDDGHKQLSFYPCKLRIDRGYPSNRSRGNCRARPCREGSVDSTLPEHVRGRRSGRFCRKEGSANFTIRAEDDALGGGRSSVRGRETSRPTNPR